MVIEMLEDKRPIRGVFFNDEQGSCYEVGSGICTKIEIYGEPGEHCYKPFIAIYKGDEITSRIPACMVQEVADEAFHTAQERSQEDAKDLESARAMPMVSHGSAFDVLVDGAARLVRPGVTLWLVGGFIGWWTLPKIETISEYWQNIFLLVLTFWFSGRALLKDLPQAIKMMRG